MPKTETLPAALYTADQVRALDRQAIERFGIPGAELMQRAGEAAFALARERWPEARCWCVLCGTGNNGGDGFVIARLAAEAGLEVRVIQLGERERIAGDARLHADHWAALERPWMEFDGALPRDCDLLIDALLGTGLDRELGGAWRAAVEAINAHSAPVLAVDIPTGLDADRGVVLGVAVRAAATISFIGLKRGLFTGEAPDCCGEVFFDALEVPAAIYASQILSARRIDWTREATRLRPRRRTAHKGDFGHVLVVGGDHGFGGAAHLAGEAAARVGAGLVSLATRKRHVAAVLAARPELMAHAVNGRKDLRSLLSRASVLVLGPGLGRRGWGDELYHAGIDWPGPQVIDADALNRLAEKPVAPRDDRVLTPHPGEAARLLGVEAAEVQADRFAAVEALQRRYGGTVVLKGAGTLVLGPGQRPLAVCSDGNPGMASGGMGDVLAGVIGGLIAQGWMPEEAAELGVCLHAAAADRAVAREGECGLLASDLMPHLRRLVKPGMIERLLHGEEEQIAFGARLGRALGPRALVFLEGDMGAGKTTLVRGLLRARGHSGAVKSPTYTLVEPYGLPGGPCYHLDLYRLGDPEELEYLGLREMLAEPALVLVEWPDRGAGWLPEPDLRLVLSYAEDGMARRVRLGAGTERGRMVISELSGG